MVSVLAASLLAPGWPGIFSLRAVVISSNDDDYQQCSIFLT
jgi:hypothetical protein